MNVAHADPWPVNNTTAFNGLVSRMRKLGVDLPPDKIIFGIQLAIGEPAAMKEYFQLLAKTSEKDLHLMKNALMETMSCILGRVSNRTHAQSLSTMADRKAAQFLEVITGLQDGHGQRTGEERQPSIHHFLSICGNSLSGMLAEAVPWSSYIHLVSMFGGSNTVYNEWLSCKAQCLIASTFQSLKAARNTTIRALVRHSDLERAWQVAYDANDPAREVSDETWQQLLKYPVGIKQWIPEMNSPAISMLSNELRRLEQRLGIVWRGAEDGYHVIESDPFWVREDESFQEGEDGHQLTLGTI
ncbi:MAG: hypothetical protein Q9217_003026 [Psora testacea]